MSRYDLSFISLLQHVALARARTLRQPTESICALNQQGSELDNVLFSLSLSFLLCRMRMESPSLPTVLWQHKWQVAPAYHEVQLTGYWRKKKKTKQPLPTFYSQGRNTFLPPGICGKCRVCMCVCGVSVCLALGWSKQPDLGKREERQKFSPQPLSTHKLRWGMTCPKDRQTCPLP